MITASQEFCVVTLSLISRRPFADDECYPVLLDITKGTSVQLKHVKYPTSFKTCLQQMVGAGYEAFETASKSMLRINNASSQLPEKIKSAVQILIAGTSPEEVEILLPLELEAIANLTSICVCVRLCTPWVLDTENASLLTYCVRDAAKTSERAFLNISALAQEMLECATFKVCSPPFICKFVAYLVQ